MMGTYTQFSKDLIEAFSMFDSVGDALDELWSLRKKKMESIDKHIAKFKMLANKLKINTTNPLSIKFFKETLPWKFALGLDSPAYKTRNTAQDYQQLVHMGSYARSQTPQVDSSY
jgi:hypothetical protein